MIQSIEKKENRGGGGEEESQDIFTVSRCNAQRWNRGVGSTLLVEMLRRGLETRKAYCGVRLSKKKRRYEFRSRTADGGVTLYGA